MRRTLAVLLVSTCLHGAASAQDQDATRIAQEPMVWITMAEDAFGILARDPGVLSSFEAPETFDSLDGVVISRLPRRDLDKVSALLYAERRRCGGFMVHDSLEEAENALINAARGSYAVLPGDFIT